MQGILLERVVAYNVTFHSVHELDLTQLMAVLTSIHYLVVVARWPRSGEHAESRYIMRWRWLEPMQSRSHVLP